MYMQYQYTFLGIFTFVGSIIFYLWKGVTLFKCMLDEVLPLDRFIGLLICSSRLSYPHLYLRILLFKIRWEKIFLLKKNWHNLPFCSYYQHYTELHNWKLHVIFLDLFSIEILRSSVYPRFKTLVHIFISILIILGENIIF